MSTSSRFLFVVAVLAGSLGARVGHADSPPSIANEPMPTENGFTILQDAVDHYSGGLAPAGTMTPTDLLRYQRGNVTRNESTLRRIRQAMALPIRHPLVREVDAAAINYDGFKKLGLLLKQESGVKYSNGDWIGAMNSDLDCIEIGIAITRGAPLDASFAGLDIENTGRRDLEAIVAKLTMQELRDSAARLAKIEGMRTAFSDALLEEKARAIAQTKQAFEQMDWTQVIEDTTKPNGSHFTDDEKATLNNIGESEVIDNLSKVMDQVEKDASAPYHPAKGAALRGADPWSRMMTDAVALPAYRVNYEQSRAQNEMIIIALLQRAQKFQTGKYSATLDLPQDPFADPAAGDTKLKYHLDGDSYVLYSVGPNSKDDGGVPVTLADDGTIPPTASGDLVGPVYNQ